MGLNNLIQMCGQSVQELDLTYTRVSGERLDATCTQLEHLVLNHCWQMTDRDGNL